jgi:hypothetical protein
MMHMPSHPAPSMLASTPLALVASASTWHQRLDHPGVDVLSKLSHDSSVICSRHTHDRCHACQLGRHIHLPFVSSNSFADNNFDLIYCDLWTSPIVSVFGYKYYLVILDDHSHFMWTFPLRIKSNTFSTLSIFSLMPPHSLAAPSKPSSATMAVSSIMSPLMHSLPPKGYICRCLVPTLLHRMVNTSASFTPSIICCIPYFLGFYSGSLLGRRAPHHHISAELPLHQGNQHDQSILCPPWSHPLL